MIVIDIVTLCFFIRHCVWKYGFIGAKYGTCRFLCIDILSRKIYLLILPLTAQLHSVSLYLLFTIILDLKLKLIFIFFFTYCILGCWSGWGKKTNGSTPERRWPQEQTLKPVLVRILLGARVRDVTQINLVTADWSKSYDETRGESLASVMAGSRGLSSNTTASSLHPCQFCFPLRWVYSLTGTLHGLHVCRGIPFFNFF